MVLRKCQICNYSTSSKFNYEKHLQTKKHLHRMSENSKKEQKNVQNCEKNVQKCAKLCTEIKELKVNSTKKDIQKSSDFECQFCTKTFASIYSLKRHISICKLNISNKKILKIPINSKNVQKSSDFRCQFCGKCFSSQSNVTRHENKCFQRHQELLELKTNFHHQIKEKELQNLLLQKDLEKEQALNQEKDKTIEVAKKSKQVINNINTTNKTVNYLNNTYGDMIAMEQFLYNLEHTEQLTQEEREKLLISFKDSGIELFARSFSHIMKENCRRQLIKEGLPDMGLIPLYCSDGNLRSHKEKGEQGWNTKYDDQNLNKMINISSNQVFQSYRKPLVIFGKDRNKVFKQLKKDNHSKNEKKKEIDND